MSIEVNSFIDLGLKIDETNNNPKNILLLGNTKGFFGSCSEDKNIFTNACGDEETIKNNYFWLENEYNVCNSNLYIIGNTDVCNYYHHIISDMARMMGKKPKYKYMDINICAKKKGISEEKEIERYYVNILKEQQGKRMKFDKIIMNPPYDGNLHLKILEQAISLLKDDGNCINLSPIRWLQDPLAELKSKSDYKTFGDSIVKKITSLKVIKNNEAREMFSMAVNEALGIYTLGTNNVEYYLSFRNTIEDFFFQKVLKPTYTGSYESVLKYRTKEGSPNYSDYFVRLPKFHSNVNSIEWYDPISRNIEISMNLPCKGTCDATINFDSKDKAINFWKSMQTCFYRYICYKAKVAQRVPYPAIPYLGSVENPRTHKIGYESEWTNKDFYEYFGITEQEQKEIEETMKPYM